MLIFQQVLYRFLLDINLTTPEGCSSTSLSAASEEDCTLPDLNTPHLRPFFKPIYTLVLTIVLYSILILIGVTGNCTENIYFEPLYNYYISILFSHLLYFYIILREFNGLPCNCSKATSSGK